MTHNERVYRERKCELFDIIYDVHKRAPLPKDFSVMFGFDNPEAEQKYHEELRAFLEAEKPEMKRKIIELRFIYDDDNQEN